MAAAKRSISAFDLENLSDLEWNDLHSRLRETHAPHLGPVWDYLQPFYDGSRGVASKEALNRLAQEHAGAAGFGSTELNQLKQHLRDHGLEHIKIRYVESGDFDAYRIGKVPLRWRKRGKAGRRA